ncbi:MAG: hypothetical protein EBU51_04210 [Synechococcaceae bacterium WB6_3A_227]|nr:hypothetical protein [Synechococcaceae bacterium WB6_3A_227]
MEAVHAYGINQRETKAEEDKIVLEASRAQMRKNLNKAEIIKLDGIGHGLLMPTLPDMVLDWLGKQ